jgi:hypothetical protein
MPMNVYAWADNSINTTPRYATGFTQLLPTRPYLMPSAVRCLYDSRLPLIRAFQQKALDIFRAALNNNTHPAILHWLINETLDSLGVSYHRGLEDRHFTLPVFFRTDEVRPGRINEIQCPGSMWGELQLAFEYAEEMGYSLGSIFPADQFAAQLSDLLQEAPLVHHLLDNTSAPAGMRYWIEKTRPGVRYWGIDHGIKVRDCNFIRSHSFYGLCGDNEFLPRLSKVGSGVRYDLPPHVLFDQKAPLILPFWSMTRRSFSDETRDLFPFTTPLLPAGIELPDGTCMSIENFSRLPRSQRSYYLKYAGANVALNWGSKAVYRLHNMGSGACLDFLRQCLSGYERGAIWLLQKEETQDDEIEYLTRDGKLHRGSFRAKFSGFYGPKGCFGVLAMHRQHFKVHGQEETVLSPVMTDGDGREPA